MSGYDNTGTNAAEERMLEIEAKQRGMSVVQYKMSLATPDDVMRDIVRDFRSMPGPSSMIPQGPSQPMVRGTGWLLARPLQPPPGQKIIDQLIDHQDALDRRELERRLAK